MQDLVRIKYEHHWCCGVRSWPWFSKICDAVSKICDAALQDLALNLQTPLMLLCKVFSLPFKHLCCLIFKHLWCYCVRSSPYLSNIFVAMLKGLALNFQSSWMLRCKILFFQAHWMLRCKVWSLNFKHPCCYAGKLGPQFSIILDATL